VAARIRDWLLTNGLELADEVALAAEAKRNCRKWSATWKAIEAAIDRFCAGVDLPRGQLLAIGYPLSPAIEHARQLLGPDRRVDRLYKAGVYQRLRHAWGGEK
jgi:hypothetical protein